MSRKAEDVVAILLRDLIRERTGISAHDDALDIFMEKLEPLILDRGFSSPLDYYYLLKYDTEAVSEWPKVANAISVRETYFWREFDPIRALVDIIIPNYFAAGHPEPFRIWSAACASGEEPLTIAMALDRAGLFERHIEIFASDVSEAALATARSGIYRERSFRSLAPALREQYFTPVERGWKIRPEISSRVSWFSANLTRPEEIAPLARANTIFCRNVFIYFNDDTIRDVVRTFAAQIKYPGHLFVGAAESLMRHTHDFVLKDVGGAFTYQRIQGGGQ